MGMEFASLSRLWWALLAVPIILLFILRVRLRRQEVSTLLFWDQLLQEHPPRAWWQRLRNLLALMLQLAFLALIVGALIDPLWSWQSRQSRQVVFVIDNSASMSTRDKEGGSTRLEQARSACQRMIGSLRQRDTAALVTAGGTPEVILAATDDVRRLKQSASAIKATDSPTDLEKAVELSRRLVNNSEQREIVIFTDGTDSALEKLRESQDIVCYGIGEETANTAITAFQVRRSLSDVTSYQILVEVTHLGEDEHECQLELTRDDQLIDVIPLTLKPGETWRDTIDYNDAEGGILLASLDVEDALISDNQARAILPEQEPIPVHLVSPGSLFLRSLFQSIPNVALTQSEQLPESIDPRTIYVIHQTELSEVPAGRLIVIDPLGTSDLWQQGEELSEPLVTEQAADSPLMAHTRLQNVLFPGAHELRFENEETTPLLTSLNGSPLYAKIPRSSGDVLVLTASLEDGDLPLRIAFPVMMKNALESLLAGKGALHPALAAGSFTTMNVTMPESSSSSPPSDEDFSEEKSVDLNSVGTESQRLILHAPDGSQIPIMTSTETVRLGPFHQTGLWRLGSPEEKKKQETANDNKRESKTLATIAVNATNREESDLRPKVELPPPPGTTLAAGGYSLWFYLSLFALLGICVEWFLYHRRIVA